MEREIAIMTAVKWWSNKVSIKTPHSNGSDEAASVTACAITDWLFVEPTSEQLNTFENCLYDGLERHIRRYLEEGRWTDTFVGCDYGPGKLLYDAAQIAGIPEANFPYKTYMRIEKNQAVADDYSVYVSDGYCAPYVEVSPYSE